MKILKLFLALFLISSLTSCIVQRPQYSRIEKVLMLQTGMTKKEVSELLGIPPYDIKSITESEEIYIYKYRVTDRKAVPFVVRENNGMKVRGKYVDLFVNYSKDGKVTKIESCTECGETKEIETKIDINKIITLITVTAPALLIYLGLQNPSQ